MEFLERCVFCNESFVDGKANVVLREKGSAGINRASEQRKDGIHTTAGQRVHVDCRRDYCHRFFINKEKCQTGNEDIQTPRQRRSQEGTFDFTKQCLFCGQPEKVGWKKKGLKIIPVRTQDFQESVLRLCHERKDEWSGIVEGRVQYAQDLHAADVVYHQACSVNFRTLKQIPEIYKTTNAIVGKSKRGRPEDNVRNDAFIAVAEYLRENDDEQVTINDLVAKMGEILHPNKEEPYSRQYMKTRLKEHFHEQIIITNLNGKTDVVTFRTTASSILYDFYKQDLSADSNDAKLKVVEAAAKIIKSEIQCIEGCNEAYPSVSDMSCRDTAVNLLPESLQGFFSLVPTLMLS